VHTSTHDAVAAITAQRTAPVDQRRFGIDERSDVHAVGRSARGGPA
jgi:hypothetical protein